MDPIRDELPHNLEKEISKLNLGPDELKAAAQRSGIASMAKEIGKLKDLDESEFNPDLSDNEDKEHLDDPGWTGIFSSLNTLSDVSDTSNPVTTPPNPKLQMSKEIMKESIAGMQLILSEMPVTIPTKRSSESVIQSWLKESHTKVTKNMKDMLMKTIEQYPDISTDSFQWILYGWNMRGEQNVVEVKNVYQSMQELITSVLSGQNNFKHESRILIDGFKDTQRGTQAILHEMKTALTSYSEKKTIPVFRDTTPVVIKSQGSSSSLPSTPKNFTPSQDMKVNMVQFLKMIGKGPDELQQFYSSKVVAQVLHSIITNMTPEDWAAMEGFRGKKNMCTILFEELDKASKPN